MVTQVTDRLLLRLVFLLTIFSSRMYYFYSRRCEKLENFIYCFNDLQRIFHKVFIETLSYTMLGRGGFPVRWPTPQDGPQWYMPPILCNLTLNQGWPMRPIRHQKWWYVTFKGRSQKALQIPHWSLICHSGEASSYDVRAAEWSAPCGEEPNCQH